MKEETNASPKRLSPASNAPGYRHTMPTKSGLPMLSPLPPSPSLNMPPPSAVLVASRSPPLSPHTSAREADDAAALETYALKIYEATKQKKTKGLNVQVPMATTKPRRVVAVPSLASNNRASKKKKKKTYQDVDAGVYLLENRKTGHRFIGTTWDLQAAEAQSWSDLTSGVHPHRALVQSVQVYGPKASGIEFSVLERVKLPTTTATPYNKAFDVKTMEKLLRQRQRYHETKLVRRVARVLVLQRLVRPYFMTYWAVWSRQTLETPRELEILAAAVVIQSVARVMLAKREVRKRREHRAASRICRFVSFCAKINVRRKRRERQRRHASATRIQHCVQHFLHRQRQHKRRVAVQKWRAARTVQRVYRGHCGRQAVRALRHATRREQSAAVLEATARGFLVRRRLGHQRHAAHLSSKATILQAWWRGIYTRQYVFQPRRDASKWTQRQETAVRRLQAFYRAYFVRHKLTHAAKQHAHELHQVTRIHAAYKNYLAKKFGWAAMTYKLEHASAVRIQMTMRRWFFFTRIARLVAIERQEKAVRRIQRVYRGAQGRQIAQKRREFVTRHRAASRVQHTWRLSHAFTKLHAAVDYWRFDKSARRIQARYRGYHGRCTYLVFRTESRRQRAATRIQSTFRSHIAKREWRRRLQLQRDGIACHDCGNAAATFYSWQFSTELCPACIGRWHGNDTSGIIDLVVYRRQQQLAISAQRIYRGFQVRTIMRFGTCGFCDVRAVRIACRTCPGTRRCCHSCDALFHQMTPASKLHSDRVRIEEYFRQHEAALVLQKHARRYAHRHTITELRRRRQTSAAVKIQKVYVSRRQRRHTRALVAARDELSRRQQCAASLLQRRVRMFLARCELKRLRTQRDSAIAIQRVFRGHCGRRKADQMHTQQQAAICIQRYARGVQGRRRADIRREQVERQKQHEATVTLQRHVRGWLVRRRMWHKRRSVAALVIQSAWRRNRAKRVLLKLLHDRDERLRLEAEAREQERQAQQRERERIAATLLQCLWRRHLACRELQMLRVALARRKRIEQLTIWLAVERKSAVRIQRFVRRKWLTHVASASLVLQCCGRQWLARRELKQRRRTKRAAISIQRAFRYARVKRKLTRLVSLEGMAVAGTVGGWVELFDEESGSVYYYNRETMASQWVKPPELMGVAPDVAYNLQPQPSLGELDVNEPPEWVEYWDDSVGASYFYNMITGEATWATPDGVTSNQSEEGSAGQWAWPPGAPFDGKMKDKETAVDYSNQAEVESVDPAATEAYYVDENGYAYAYDYSQAAYGYDYSAYVDHNAAYASPSAAYSLDPPGEGFDESPVDTSYDINYEIYMTQLQRDAEQGQDQGSPDA